MESSLCLDFCLVNHQLKVVYAFVPKAACTSIKIWLMRAAGADPEFLAAVDRADAAGLRPGSQGFPCVHTQIDRKWSLARLPAEKAAAIITDPGYFKFTIVRHPLSRLVSAYLNKIVGAKSAARRVIRNSQLRNGHLGLHVAWGWLRGKPFFDAERSLTFREFAQQVARENQDRIDPHFRPQSRLLQGIELDFVGRLENIHSDFEFVRRRLGIAAPLPESNIRREDISQGSECAADWPASRFRTGGAPKWPHFYDASLLKLADKLYAADFARFEYDCRLPAERLRNAA